MENKKEELLNNLIDWLGEHDTAMEDFLRHYNMSYDEIEEIIS